MAPVQVHRKLGVFALACAIVTVSGDRAGVTAGTQETRATRVFTLVPSTHGNPEGIAVDPRTGAFFVSAVGDGTIYRGSLDSDVLTPFIPGQPDSQATGLEVHRGLLYVAGGFSGSLRVYDASTGESRAVFADFGAAMLNDVAVTARGDVYITDSFAPVLWHVTAAQVAAGGGVPAAIPMTPEIDWDDAGFNLNGIVALRGGRTLIVAQSDAGKLFRIDLDAEGGRQITEIALEQPLYIDGLLRDQGRLVAVTFATEATLTFVRLDLQSNTGTVEERRTDPSFRGPSAVARVGNLYLVVNFDFEGGTVPFTVSGLWRQPR